jgi:hypothetical protein
MPVKQHFNLGHYDGDISPGQNLLYIWLNGSVSHNASPQKKPGIIPTYKITGFSHHDNS